MTRKFYELSDKQVEQIRTLIDMHERLMGRPSVTPYKGLKLAIARSLPEDTTVIIMSKCPICGGTGRIPIVSSSIYDEGTQECFNCDGTGRLLQANIPLEQGTEQYPFLRAVIGLGEMHPHEHPASTINLLHEFIDRYAWTDVFSVNKSLPTIGKTHGQAAYIAAILWRAESNIYRIYLGIQETVFGLDIGSSMLYQDETIKVFIANSLTEAMSTLNPIFEAALQRYVDYKREDMPGLKMWHLEPLKSGEEPRWPKSQESDQ